jgi:hypothetical protein
MRSSRTQLGIAQRADEGEYASANPQQQQREPGIRALGDDARCQEDAAADNAADHDQGSIPWAQAALVTGLGSRHEG